MKNFDRWMHRYFSIELKDTQAQVIDVWVDPVYKENLKQMVSFYRHTRKKRIRDDWHGEVFGSVEEMQDIEKIYREKFYDCHGIASAFYLLSKLFKDARKESDDDKRAFLLRHIYPAALAMAFHDRCFREALRELGINSMEFKRHPFAVLLMYLDSLQEDKRGMYSEPYKPLFLEGINFEEKTVRPKIVLSDDVRIGKMRAEFLEINEFVVFDEIKLLYPDEIIGDEKAK